MSNEKGRKECNQVHQSMNSCVNLMDPSGFYVHSKEFCSLYHRYFFFNNQRIALPLFIGLAISRSCTHRHTRIQSLNVAQKGVWRVPIPKTNISSVRRYKYVIVIYSVQRIVLTFYCLKSRMNNYLVFTLAQIHF